VPFLRLTRDRRGFENTFLMHADRPGDRPRVLYWYRTAPGIVLGRPPLDEDAIRTIEEQHPDIDFDWPAILALSEVMTPEEEAPARPPEPRQGRRQRGRSGPRPGRETSRADAESGEPSVSEPQDLPDEELADGGLDTGDADEPVSHLGERFEPEPPAPPAHHAYGLLEELVGREIATRLRARYAEIAARVHAHVTEPSLRDAWLKRAEPLNPDLWLTPESILDGVRHADPLFEQLRRELLASL
jgi:hypothetical protein